MTFKKFNESFDNPYKYKETTPGTYNFTTNDGSEINFVIDDAYDEEDKHYCGIRFDRDGEIEMTNQGDAFRIFATVIKIIQKEKSFLKSLDYVVFSGKSSDKSRASLYSVFAKKLNKELKFKNLIKIKHAGDSVFILTNLEKSYFV